MIHNSSSVMEVEIDEANYHAICLSVDGVYYQCHRNYTVETMIIFQFKVFPIAFYCSMVREETRGKIL